MAEPTTVFLASHNPGKIAEVQRILAEHAPGISVVGIDGLDGPAGYAEPVEDQPTFAGNALLKAYAGVRGCGLPSIADDSGLCVDALNGMPGVLSARWAGGAAGPFASGDGADTDTLNNRLLLAQLADVPDDRRGAHFECAVAFCYPAGEGEVTERVVHGRMPGRVIREMRGDGGFGYDVVFVPAEQENPERTSAELGAAEKDAVSHRGRALREAAPVVAEVLAGL